MGDTYTTFIGRSEGESVALFMLGYFLGGIQSEEGKQIFRACQTSVEDGAGYVRFLDSGSRYKISVECIEPPTKPA